VQLAIPCPLTGSETLTNRKLFTRSGHLSPGLARKNTKRGLQAVCGEPGMNRATSSSAHLAMRPGPTPLRPARWLVNCTAYGHCKARSIPLERNQRCAEGSPILRLGGALLRNPTNRCLDKLQEEFHLHANWRSRMLIAAHPRRTKIEVYGEFAVHRRGTTGADGASTRSSSAKPHLFLGRNYLVSVRHGAFAFVCAGQAPVRIVGRKCFALRAQSYALARGCWISSSDKPILPDHRPRSRSAAGRTLSNAIPGGGVQTRLPQLYICIEIEEELVRMQLAVTPLAGPHEPAWWRPVSGLDPRRGCARYFRDVGATMPARINEVSRHRCARC